MTKDDIIRMAREAGYKHPDAVGEAEDFAYFDFERFAALVAAAERERVAGYMTRRGFEPTSTNDIVEMLEEMFWFSEERFLKSVRTQVVGDALVAAVKAEREACAKICDKKAKEWLEMRGWLDDFSNEIATAIRARGQ